MQHKEANVVDIWKESLRIISQKYFWELTVEMFGQWQ